MKTNMPPKDERVMEWCDYCKENVNRAKKLEKALSEIGKYAHIIKIGSKKESAIFLEAEQIERIVKEHVK